MDTCSLDFTRRMPFKWNGSIDEFTIDCRSRQIDGLAMSGSIRPRRGLARTARRRLWLNNPSGESKNGLRSGWRCCLWPRWCWVLGGAGEQLRVPDHVRRAPPSVTG
jgi:hypothetical protein